MDLGGWPREDPDGVLTVRGGRVSWVKADRTTVRYVGIEAGVVGDFRHCFVVCIDRFGQDINKIVGAQQRRKFGDFITDI